MQRKSQSKSRLKIAVGRDGEEIAAAYLIENGYSILTRNLRTPYGEIDLIAQKGSLTVFVEVKTRTSLAYGLPETSLTKSKLAHFSAAIQHYMQENPGLGGEWRADVLAILAQPSGNDPQIVHFENVLE